MKVVAFNGSPRQKGNTSILINLVVDELQAQGIDTEIVQVGGKKIRGCAACLQCFGSKDGRCAIDNDLLNSCVEKMRQADGILLGSPTYFCNVSAEVKALIDRAGLVAKANDDMLRYKVGAAVVAVRRAGALPVFNAINHFFLINQMIVPGSSYWNLGIGLEPGDVQGDEEGIQTMKTLGQNIARLLKKLA